MSEPSSEQAAWPYDVIAELYDQDIAPNADPRDEPFYRAAAARSGGRVLELGAGTGRLTLPIIGDGAQVTALDRSRPMLEVLRARADRLLSAEALARLSIRHADMRAPGLHQGFDLVICPFSAFAYLVTDDDRKSALVAIKACLNSGGRFVLDVFVPDPRLRSLPEGSPILDYRRSLSCGGVLERHKLIRYDVMPRTNLVERRYRIERPGHAVQRLLTLSRVRNWLPEELAAELERHGFRIERQLADFEVRPLGPETRTAVFECSAVAP